MTSEGDLIPLATASISGTATGGALASLDAGGDFDADGLSDLVVSDVADSGAVIVSSAYIFYGADLKAGGAYTTDDRGASFLSNDTLDYTGYAGQAADLDGDGFDDLMLGAPRATVNAGAMYIYQSLLGKE
jgi:hypothetical protein